ncbi:MAG: AAA family ATPase, partial [Muribaculaceae bacterium]|nr:AAA family ATPase [Muribaculaceae bacterium]
MLQSLIIKNYALIDNVSLTFSPGFTIITGETGAGKSIMLGALSLLLGERAETKAISDKSRKSVIEATFTHPD